MTIVKTTAEMLAGYLPYDKERDFRGACEKYALHLRWDTIDKIDALQMLFNYADLRALARVRAREIMDGFPQLRL